MTILLFISFLLTASLTVPQVAHATSTYDIAPDTVTAWLQQIDHHEYQASWKNASQYLQHAINQPQWERIIKTVREPIGAVISRRHMITQYATHLPGIPDGTYAILQFDSKFTKKDSTIESVVFTKEAVGQWRAIGDSMK